MLQSAGREASGGIAIITLAGFIRANMASVDPVLQTMTQRKTASNLRFLLFGKIKSQKFNLHLNNNCTQIQTEV